MSLTPEQTQKQTDERMKFGAKVAFKCFTGPEHEYQVAIQTEEYTKERQEFLQSVFNISDNETILKKTITTDFNQWRRNHV